MIKKLILKIGGGWIFLAIVCLLYIITAIINIDVLRESYYFLKIILIQVVPVLFIVFLFMYLSNLFLSSKKVVRYLGSGSGWEGWFFAIIFGIMSSGPIYMWYPLLSDLKAKGMKNSLMAVFLYNRAVKIPLMPMILLYFGWPFLAVMTVLMIFFSVINGFIVGKLVPSKLKNN